MDIAGRDNNLNLLRFLAALSVIYSHAFGVTPEAAEEPIHARIGAGPGDLGVNLFFFVSGLLVTKSFAGRSLGQFVMARLLRIYPGLWVSIVIILLLAGAFWSPLDAGAFWSQGETVSYIWRNATMLPGVGAQLALPNAISGPAGEFNVSLWTLPHELQMYALLAAVCFIVHALRRPWIFVILCALGLLNWTLSMWGGEHFIGADRARFMYFFFAGSLAYCYREHVSLSSRPVLACLAVVFATALIGPATAALLAVSLTLPYLVLYFAYVPGGLIRKWNLIGDYSYGLYIYAFPFQAMLATQVQSPLANMALTTALVLPLAVVSWHFVEKPALRWVRVPERRAKRTAPEALQLRD